MFRQWWPTNLKDIFMWFLHFSALCLCWIYWFVSHLMHLSLTKPTMQHCFHPNTKHLLYKYMTPSFASHFFCVNSGKTWYLFAILPLCILISVQSQLYFWVVMQVELLEWNFWHYFHLLTLWRPLGFWDFQKKKCLNARGFAREFLRSGKSQKMRQVF